MNLSSLDPEDAGTMEFVRAHAWQITRWLVVIGLLTLLFACVGEAVLA